MMSVFYSMFWREKPERNSLTPNSFAPMPKWVFHNYAIEKRDHDDDEEPNKSIWNLLDLQKTFKRSIFYTLYPPRY